MIAVGIPTYNEVENISKLTESIDSAAKSLSEDIVIINSDNSSYDGTSKVFQKTKTLNQKVSLTTKTRGKGYNIKNIINYVAYSDKISYCMLIDGDIISFKTKWLKKHIDASKDGYDYVVPNYSRYMQEGNTTNHFIYPLLSHLTSGNAPYQGIAGDFGLSNNFVQYLKGLDWPYASLGYGIDIFMTMHALFGGMKVHEISLGNKIHKPSFDKMVGMFQEVAESYYATRQQGINNTNINFSKDPHVKFSLLAGKPIDSDRVNDRLDTAIELFKKNKTNKLDIAGKPNSNQLSSKEWAHILAIHELKVSSYTPRQLAESLTPFYLTRVVTYLNTTSTTDEAELEITKTAKLLNKELGDHYDKLTN